MLVGAGGLLLAWPAVSRLVAQEPPNRREFTIVAKDFRYTPARLEVSLDDLVRLTVIGDDSAHSFAIDAYRIVKRVPAGGTLTFEFRADRAGTFPFYCSLTNDPAHQTERGEFVVRGK